MIDDSYTTNDMIVQKIPTYFPYIYKVKVVINWLLHK